MTTDESFDPNHYWEDRLAKNWGLNAVGFMGLGDGYNRALYRVKGQVFRRMVQRVIPDVSQANVLDIGSGTGFVLEQWLRLGSQKITGSDITAFAVNQLQKQFPTLSIQQLDIGGNLPDSLQPETFDSVSALDVLYHIVDDQAYQQALSNISKLLKPGGCFFLADNFLHGPPQRGRHQVSHSLQTLQAWLGAVDLHIVYRVPQYVLMNYPIDSQNRLLHWWWPRLVRQVARSERRSLWLGRALAPIDMLLTRLLSEGPSTELAVCRKGNR